MIGNLVAKNFCGFVHDGDAFFDHRVVWVVFAELLDESSDCDSHACECPFDVVALGAHFCSELFDFSVALLDALFEFGVELAVSFPVC